MKLEDVRSIVVHKKRLIDTGINLLTSKFVSEEKEVKYDCYMCDIFGVNHIWLQSDAAFVYPRLD